MRFNICLLFLITYVTSVPSCTARSYCMGCNSATANICDSCFNWGSGKVGARALSSNTCTNLLSTTAINDCKIYSGTNDGSTQTISNCFFCGKDFLNLNSNDTTVTCSNTSSHDTCSDKLLNCNQTVCSTTDGSTYTLSCGLCKKKYAGAGTATTNAGYNSCSPTGVLTNCEYHYLSGSSTLACYSCKSNYAVASTAISCTAYTTDGNCRMLNSSGDCNTCWHSYYWDASTCKLTAFVTIFSSVALAIFTLLN